MKLQTSISVFAAGILVSGCAVRGVHKRTVNGPTALITSYRAKPEARARFRRIMSTEGVAQLERWKQQGVFRNYQALFTTYAADTTPDMYLILRFDHFTDLAAWQKIEETMPGGLPEDAQAIAAADTSGTADIVKENSAAATTKDSQFFVLQYDVLTDTPKYTRYVLGYAVPQFDAWEKTGALSSYAAYVNQNPAGAPWSSFILLEYKDLKALAEREVIKDKARAATGGEQSILEDMERRQDCHTERAGGYSCSLARASHAITGRLLLQLVQLRLRLCRFERDIAILGGERSEQVLAFLRERQAHVLAHPGLQRLAGRSVEVDPYRARQWVHIADTRVGVVGIFVLGHGEQLGLSHPSRSAAPIPDRAARSRQCRSRRGLRPRPSSHQWRSRPTRRADSRGGCPSGSRR